MNLPERFAPDDPREWLNRARSNLALANSRISGAYLEDLCFDAQQAAEKAIKAVMIARDIDFPYMHDLGSLLTLLEENGETIPEAGRSRGDVAHHIRHHYSLPQCRQPRRGARVSGSDCHRRRSGPMGGGAIVIVPGHERRSFPATATPGASRSPKATSPRWTPACSPARPMPAVDPDTGAVEILDYVLFEDCGRRVNSMILEGR